MQTNPAEDPIELSTADAREMARLLGLLLKKEVRAPEQNLLLGSAPAEPVQLVDERAILVAKARVLFADRKRRSQHFSQIMFGEPAWDMLLALYITDFAGAQQSIGRLVGWIGAPQSTVLRWIKYLEDEHLISRRAHPRDHRSVIVEISERGRDLLDRYFSDVLVPLSG